MTALAPLNESSLRLPTDEGGPMTAQRVESATATYTGEVNNPWPGVYVATVMKHTDGWPTDYIIWSNYQPFASAAEARDEADRMARCYNTPEATDGAA